MNALSRAAPCAALLAALLAPWPSRAEPADDVVASVGDHALRALLGEVLSKNPQAIAARARALAADQRAAQETALADPELMVTAFARSPDMQAAVEYSQRYEPASRRRLRGEAAGREALAAWADLETRRLLAVTEAREAWIEIAYLDLAARIARGERAALVHFESLARARYAAGEGLQRDAVRLQAEITRTELELVEIQSERTATVLAFNALRGRPGQLELGAPSLPEPPGAPDPRAAAARAAALRPELRAAAARLDAARSRRDLARAQRRPDVTLRGGWAFMSGGGEHDEPRGLRNDEAMVSVGLSLPVRRRKLDAMLEQAVQEQHAAAAERDASALDVERDAAQAAHRIAFTLRQLALYEGVLTIQADEALRSAEAAYSTGLVGSLELLDAERELFGIRHGAARARADLALLAARLEGVMGGPLALLGASTTILPPPSEPAAEPEQVTP